MIIFNHFLNFIPILHLQPPVDTKVILGHVASMQCRVSADRNVQFEVDWFHEGRLINAAASHRINIGIFIYLFGIRC